MCVLQDIKKAIEVLDTSCSGGLADSCNMLAKQLLRQDGKGPTPRDPPRAKALLEKGCSHNHGPSCYNLTVMLKKGDDGVPRCVYGDVVVVVVVVVIVLNLGRSLCALLWLVGWAEWIFSGLRAFLFVTRVFVPCFLSSCRRWSTAIPKPPG